MFHCSTDQNTLKPTTITQFLKNKSRDNFHHKSQRSDDISKEFLSLTSPGHHQSSKQENLDHLNSQGSVNTLIELEESIAEPLPCKPLHLISVSCVVEVVVVFLLREGNFYQFLVAERRFDYFLSS